MKHETKEIDRCDDCGNIFVVALILILTGFTGGQVWLWGKKFVSYPWVEAQWPSG
uniref:Uncharacterized protein n=1 Tax=Octopus bimaculoides TaxID=37653 RepID=A0A0L8I6H4_OCTBM